MCGFIRDGRYLAAWIGLSQLQLFRKVVDENTIPRKSRFQEEEDVSVDLVEKMRCSSMSEAEYQILLREHLLLRDYEGANALKMRYVHDLAQQYYSAGSTRSPSACAGDESDEVLTIRQLQIMGNEDLPKVCGLSKVSLLALSLIHI